MMKYFVQSILFLFQFITSAIYLPNLRFWKHSDKSIQEYLKKIESRSVNHKHLGWSLTGDNPEPPTSSFRTNYLCVSLGKGKDIYLKACEIMRTFQMTKSIGWAEVHCPPRMISKRQQSSSSNRSVKSNTADDGNNNNNNEGYEFDLRKDRPLCTLAKCFGIIWVLNPCRIISDSFGDSSTTDTTSSSSNNSKVNNFTGAKVNTITDGSDKMMMVSFTTVDGHLLAGEERFGVRYIHDRSNKNSDDNGEVLFDMYSFSKPANILGFIALPYVRYVQKPFFRQQAEGMKRLLSSSS